MRVALMILQTLQMGCWRTRRLAVPTHRHHRLSATLGIKGSFVQTNDVSCVHRSHRFASHHVHRIASWREYSPCYSERTHTEKYKLLRAESEDVLVYWVVVVVNALHCTKHVTRVNRIKRCQHVNASRLKCATLLNQRFTNSFVIAHTSRTYIDVSS